jgi:hypothetical protein
MRSAAKLPFGKPAGSTLQYSAPSGNAQSAICPGRSEGPAGAGGISFPLGAAQVDLETKQTPRLIEAA